MNKAWTPEENAAICALYFAMLDKALAGEAYNKRAMIRHAQMSGDECLGYRSKGSIEAKLMNCTACHESLAPHAVSMNGHGYRPLTRYQSSLKDAMREALADSIDRDVLTAKLIGFELSA